MNMDQDAHAHLVPELQGFPAKTGQFRIRIEGRFEASHYLYKYFEDGSDEPMHGHSWQVEVFLGRTDGSTGTDGISYDFLAARRRLGELVDRVEHVCINNLSEFSGVNPTAENIARWFYSGLIRPVTETGGRIYEVRVHEGPSNFAVYLPTA